MDAIRDLAFPLPVLVICELLGIPQADRETFRHAVRLRRALLNPTPPTRAELDAANAGSLRSAAYFNALFEQRRRAPQDDLITQLVQAEEAGDRLSTAELRANVNLLFAAGHETTVNLIGNGILALLRHPEQWAMLRDDPSLIPNAIEEILRYELSGSGSVADRQLNRWNSAERRYRRTMSWCRWWVAQTVTRRCSMRPTGSTSPARTSSRCRSVAASISASARNWLGSRQPWCSPRWCAGSRRCD